MYKICKTEKSIERQKQFQSTLLAMMEDEIFSDISVTALCKEMGVPRKAFYRYYGTLEDVLYAILDETLTEAFLKLEIRTDLIGFFTYWKEQKSLLDVLEKSGLSALLFNRIYDRINLGSYMNLEENDHLLYSGYVTAIMTMLLSWHHSGMKQSVEEMSKLVKNMFKLKS